MISLPALSALALSASPLLSAAPTWGLSSYESSPDEQQVPQTPGWAAGAVTEYPVHVSCNNSESALLRQALTEAEILAAHARDHILRWGNSSSYYQKYFGAANSGEPVGWFDKVVHGDKAGVLFRCDDPDRNCATQDAWAGHWRGSNASDESVICELSFTAKWPLAGLCGYGYTVASHSTTAYFASDLLHRLYHTDKVGEGVVGHYADDYEACLQLAVDNPQEAVRNSATLRYFALDVYAYDISNPGLGCTGEPVEEEHDHSADTSSSAAASSASSTAGSSSTAVEVQTSSTAVGTQTSSVAESTSATSASAAAQTIEATVTTSAATECHTHSDGEVHCV